MPEKLDLNNLTPESDNTDVSSAVNPPKSCPNCGELENFFLTESITYRASFDEENTLQVYGNKDNSIDSIHCNECDYEFTMAEIGNTETNFN